MRNNCRVVAVLCALLLMASSLRADEPLPAARVKLEYPSAWTLTDRDQGNPEPHLVMLQYEKPSITVMFYANDVKRPATAEELKNWGRVRAESFVRESKQSTNPTIIQATMGGRTLDMARLVEGKTTLFWAFFVANGIPNCIAMSVEGTNWTTPPKQVVDLLQKMSWPEPGNFTAAVALPTPVPVPAPSPVSAPAPAPSPAAAGAATTLDAGGLKLTVPAAWKRAAGDVENQADCTVLVYDAQGGNPLSVIALDRKPTPDVGGAFTPALFGQTALDAVQAKYPDSAKVQCGIGPQVFAAIRLPLGDSTIFVLPYVSNNQGRKITIRVQAKVEQLPDHITQVLASAQGLTSPLLRLAAQVPAPPAAQALATPSPLPNSSVPVFQYDLEMPQDLLDLRQQATADLPPVTLAPRQPMEAFTGGRPGGEVLATKALMRTMIGPMTAAEEVNFNKKWGPYYQHPTAKGRAHLKKLNPLLLDTIQYHQLIMMATQEYDAAVEEARIANLAGDEDGYREAALIAQMQSQSIKSASDRLAQIAKEAEAIGELPAADKLEEEAKDTATIALAALSTLAQKYPAGGKDDANTRFGTIVGSWTQTEVVIIPHELSELPGQSKNALLKIEDGKAHLQDQDRLQNFIYSWKSPPKTMTCYSDSKGGAGVVTNGWMVQPKIEDAGCKFVKWWDGFHPQEASLSWDDGTVDVGKRPGRERGNSGEIYAIGTEAVKVEFFEDTTKKPQITISPHSTISPQSVLPPDQAYSAPGVNAAQWIPSNNENRAADHRWVFVVHCIPGTVYYVYDWVPGAAGAVAKPADFSDEITTQLSNIASAERARTGFEQELANTADAETARQLRFNILHCDQNIHDARELIESIKTGTVVHTRGPWEEHATAVAARTSFDLAEEFRRTHALQASAARILTVLRKHDPVNALEAQRAIFKKFGSGIYTPEGRAAALESLNHLHRLVQNQLGVEMDELRGRQDAANEELRIAGRNLGYVESVRDNAGRALFVASLFTPVGPGMLIQISYQGTCTGIEEGPLAGIKAAAKEAAMGAAIVGGMKLTGAAYNLLLAEEAQTVWSKGFSQYLAAKEKEAAIYSLTGQTVGEYEAMLAQLKGTASKIAGQAGSGAAGEVLTIQQRIAAARQAEVLKKLARPKTAWEQALQQAALGQEETWNLALANQAKKRLAAFQQAKTSGVVGDELQKLGQELNDAVAAVNGSSLSKRILKRELVAAEQAVKDAGRTLVRARKTGQSVAEAQALYNQAKQEYALVETFHSEFDARLHDMYDRVRRQVFNEAEKDGIKVMTNLEKKTLQSVDSSVMQEWRNASSKGINADGDYGPKAQFENGFVQNGTPMTAEGAMENFQGKYNTAYKKVFGRTAEASDQCITTSAHSEAFPLEWLKKSSVKTASPESCRKAGQAMYNKVVNALSSTDTPIVRFQKACASLAKDLKTKALERLKTTSPGPGLTQAQIDSARTYWTEVQHAMDNFAAGKANSIETSNLLRELGGTSNVAEFAAGVQKLMNQVAGVP